MNKFKSLLKNVGLLTISNFGSKILSFLLIPLYTHILSTAEYGTYDIYLTTISLMIPILTLGIADAVMLFAMEYKEKSKHILKIAFKGMLIGVLILTLLVVTNSLFHIIPIYEEFGGFLIFMFMFDLTLNILSQYARSKNKVNHIAISGIMQSVMILLLNILFLLVIRNGLYGYFWANTLAYVFPIAYLLFTLKIFKQDATDDKSDNNIAKAMYKYSIPMIFSNLGWWVTNISDRYMITWMCGVAANGIYSIAYKIPSLINIFQSIFSQAWGISAIENNKDTKFFEKVYEIYNCCLVIICSFLIIMAQLIAAILYSKDFYKAWEYSPFLMISVVFGSLIGFLGGIFAANKKSKGVAVSTVIGAVINVILNGITIPLYGPMAAAISTLISYVVVWIIRIILINRLQKINIKLIKHILSYLILLIQAIILVSLNHLITMYFIEIILLSINLILYKNEMKELITKTFNMLTGRDKNYGT